MQERLMNSRRKNFVVMKDGISFCFQRSESKQPELQGHNVLSEFHLDQVFIRVKILPEKHKRIKLPIHFYGELVKTKAGAHFLK